MTSSPDSPRACPDCLRRAQLLALLAPYIERVSSGAPGSRPPQLLCLANQDLAQAVAPQTAARLLAEVEALPEQSLRSSVASAGCWASCRHDAAFPAGLRDAADAPWAIFGRGDPALLREIAELSAAVAIVGARRASAYGREVARSLGRDLAAAGLTVISGMAFGIDACAHRGALEAGRTVAVLGCGADVAYPASHRSLWRRIQESGLVLSELPPGTGAWRWSFPARSRIIAALAGMTVVVEAAERSGSLVTADLAADLGRELGAVPGPISSRASAGPNQLLVGGARLVRDAQDVLDALLGPGARRLMAPDPRQLFDFDLAKARVDILDRDRALWPVNAYSDADELNALFEAAIQSGAIARRRGDPRIHIYPLSISEPEPILAVDPGQGPSLLGHSLKLRERDGEDPVAFTLRLLAEVTDEANALTVANPTCGSPSSGPAAAG